MNTSHDPDDALIEGMARVVAVDSALVWLTAEQPAACGSCATRSACGSASHATKTAASWRAPRSLGEGQTPLMLGDRVRVGVDRHALTRASLTAYALPLVTMLMAASAMQGAGDGAAIAGALVGLLVGVAAARVLVKRWRDALVPMVLGRATTASGASCAPSSASGQRIAIPVIEKRSV